MAECIMEEGYVNVFVAITASQGGGLSEESLSCVVDFAREHQHYVALINPDSYDLTTMTPSDYAEIADDHLSKIVGLLQRRGNQADAGGFFGRFGAVDVVHS